MSRGTRIERRDLSLAQSVAALLPAATATLRMPGDHTCRACGGPKPTVRARRCRECTVKARHDARNYRRCHGGAFDIGRWVAEFKPDERVFSR